MMGLGFAGFGWGTWLVTGMTSDWDFWELFWPQILRGGSLILCMVPINNIALGTLSAEKLKNASGLFNLTRNLGGAVGLAIINTIIMRRTDFHYERLSESVQWGNRQAIDMLNALASKLDMAGLNPKDSALMQLYNIVRQQATVMAFIDAFFILTLLFAILTLLVFAVKKPKTLSGGVGGH